MSIESLKASLTSASADAETTLEKEGVATKKTEEVTRRREGKGWREGGRGKEREGGRRRGRGREKEGGEWCKKEFIVEDLDDIFYISDTQDR